MTEIVKTDRLVWVEPAVRELDVEETAGTSGRGGDQGVAHVDCTKS